MWVPKDILVSASLLKSETLGELGRSAFEKVNCGLVSHRANAKAHSAIGARVGFGGDPSIRRAKVRK